MLDKNFENLDPLGDGGKTPMGPGGWMSSDEGEEEDCPFAETIISIALMPKPFGMTWPSDKMIEFLKKRGYKIFERWDDDEEEEIHVAVKPNEQKLPGNNNILETFVNEVQDIILNWLSKLDKN